MRKTRLLALLWCAVIICSTGHAQKRAYEIFAETGAYFDGKELYDNVIANAPAYFPSVGAGVFFRPETGYFASALNYPEFGISISQSFKGKMEYRPDGRLGNFTDLYGSVFFNLSRFERVCVGPLLELGAAYTPVKWNHRSNPGNLYIGSNIEALLGVGMKTRFEISPNWALVATLRLSHHSNGMTRVPNWGVNKYSAVAGIRYTPSRTSRVKSQKPQPPQYKKLSLNASFAAGVHSCDVELRANRADEKKGMAFPEDPAPVRARIVGAIEGEWRYSPVLSSSIGTEIMYAPGDYRRYDLSLEGREDPRGYSDILSGIFAVQSLYYGNFSLRITVGRYVFKKLGIAEDVSAVFEKAGIRYYLNSLKGTFLGLDVRAHHWDRSYCIEWSAGIKF